MNNLPYILIIDLLETFIEMETDTTDSNQVISPKQGLARLSLININVL